MDFKDFMDRTRWDQLTPVSPSSSRDEGGEEDSRVSIFTSAAYFFLVTILFPDLQKASGYDESRSTSNSPRPWAQILEFFLKNKINGAPIDRLSLCFSSRKAQTTV